MKCDCGADGVVLAKNLLNGATRSCGCLRSEETARSKRSDIQSFRFGRLVAQNYLRTENTGKAVWSCLCDCGNRVEVSGDSLRQGKTRSCGCLRAEEIGDRCKLDLSGKAFGFLVIEAEEGRNARHQVRWRCRCACGGMTVVDGSALRRGLTISCGCKVSPKPVRTLSVRMASAARNSARRARIRGAGGRHTDKEIQALFERQGRRCAECRKRLKSDEIRRDHKIPLARGGSDHISNIQVLCGPCNGRKHAKDPLCWARERGRLL